MNTAEPAIQPVVKTVRVRVSRDRAFRFFTANLGRWWPSRFSIGSSPIVDARVEPRVGGRWYEIGQDGSICQWGEVLAWNPPHGLVLAWRINSHWQYDPDLLTEVAVSFHAVSNNETDVTLEHRKLENYGESVGQMAEVFGSPGGWSAALDRYAEAIERES